MVWEYIYFKLEERSCFLRGWRDGRVSGGFVWFLVSVDELKVTGEIVYWVASSLGWLFVFVIPFSELYRRDLFSEADDGADG